MVDSYTKCVLTVIAIALVAIVIREGVVTTHAASEITKVAICNESGEPCLPVYTNKLDGKVGIIVFKD